MTTVLNTLAYFWAIGTFLILVCIFFEMAEGILEKLVTFFIGVPVWCLFAAMPFGYIEYVRGPKLATLLKSEWQCTTQHIEPTFSTSGKVLVPAATPVCDVYERIVK